MSRIVEDPPIEAARSHFSQLCVLLTGVAAGVVEPSAGESLQSPSYHMGRRDGYHVVVAHLASSRSLREAADKCVAFGRGVEERANTHPYGPDWCHGFAQATLDAAQDLAMYAATCTLPQLDRQRAAVSPHRRETSLAVSQQLDHTAKLAGPRRAGSSELAARVVTSSAAFTRATIHD